MQTRQEIWRQRLIGEDIVYKRYVYQTHIQGGTEISQSTLLNIVADIPRTFSDSQLKCGDSTIKRLLVEYASVQAGDNYLQGFSYFMKIFCQVFHLSEHAEADTFWCFSKLVGIIRPLMPDFNCEWFAWNRKFWVNDLVKRLGKKRPLLEAILQTEIEIFSSLILVKWYMLWFAQNIVFEEVIELWDFLVNVNPCKRMYTYNCIALVIIEQAADNIVYQCGGQATAVIYKLLSLKIKNVGNLIRRLKKIKM